jgi:hypothetical protein
VLILNRYTRWGYGDLMNMDLEEMAQWTTAAIDIYRRKR